MLNKKSTYLFLVLIFLINILLRYPITKHETGVDSFSVHTLANTINYYGNAKWFIHPMSFIGLYPLSQESGAPFFLSAFSQLTNIHMEYTILVVSLFLSFLAILGTFMLGKILTSNRLYSLFLASMYSTSRLFLDFTDWTFSTRGIFIALLPVLFYTSFRLIKNSFSSSRDFLVFSLVILTSITLHKLFFYTSDK